MARVGPRLPALLRHVAYLADVHSPVHEESSGSHDVGDHQVGSLDGVAVRITDTDPEADRTRGARRVHLDHTELVVGLVVDVDRPAKLLGVEGLGPVDVGDGQQDELEAEVHHESLMASQSRSGLVRTWISSTVSIVSSSSCLDGRGPA